VDEQLSVKGEVRQEIEAPLTRIPPSNALIFYGDLETHGPPKVQAQSHV